MISKSQCVILWIFALVLITRFLYESHCSMNQPGSAVAFSILSTAQVAIRIKGPGAPEGIYRFPDGTTIGGVIKMTVMDCDEISRSSITLDSRISPGLILEINPRTSSTCQLSVTYMKAVERMTLGIPLDPAQMDEDDWDALPGIGPKIARDIMAYRHNNGAFSSLDDLENITGLSAGKILKIRKFF